MGRRPAIASWTLISTGLLMAAPLLALPLPLPPPPPPLPEPVLAPPRGSEPGPGPAAIELSGGQLAIQGRAQRARWRWIGDPDAPPRQLWLPLEVLQGQLGVSSRSLGASGGLELEWFGRRQLVAPEGQRALGDEVALDAAPLLAGSGLVAIPRGDLLELRLPPPLLLGVRPSAAPPGQRRVVLDLSGPALLSREEGALVVALQSRPEQRAGLEELGLRGRQSGAGLKLASRSGQTPTRILTLGEPHRVVIDLPGGPAAAGGEATGATPLDPRLQARLGQQILWDRLVREVGGRKVRINAIRIDPAATDLELRPLSRGDGMEGLSSLAGLARRQDALVAINGGFFNRIRRLPLGALRDRGAWLSGPILNRGAIGWERGRLPRFGRLQLQEWVQDRNGNRWSLMVLNSGYVQRGISRYTADWGPAYRSLSNGENAVLLRQGVVRARYGPEALAAGIPLAPGDALLVGRGGFAVPWEEGDPLVLESRPSSSLGEASFVLGGGPLLLAAGQPALDGAAEGFGPAFLSQGAPRTVIGSDGRQLWLLTLEGVEDDGPTLAESTLLLRQLGLRDALNLDGGSSTGLVMGGRHTVKGRGVVSAVHNGLGLVPSVPRSDGGGAGS
jgi:hypothetical protein